MNTKIKEIESSISRIDAWFKDVDETLSLIKNSKTDEERLGFEKKLRLLEESGNSELGIVNSILGETGV